MEIIDSNVALLSNWEILHHLQGQRAKRSTSTASATSVKNKENQRTLEFEIIQYLQDPECSKCSKHTKNQISLFLSQFKDIPLKKAEKIQILNTHPQSLLDLHLIIEECEERFTEEQLNDILTSISVLFSPTTSTQKHQHSRSSHLEKFNSTSESVKRTEKMLIDSSDAILHSTSMENDPFVPDFDDI